MVIELGLCLPDTARNPAPSVVWCDTDLLKVRDYHLRRLLVELVLEETFGVGSVGPHALALFRAELLGLM